MRRWTQEVLVLYFYFIFLRSVHHVPLFIMWLFAADWLAKHLDVLTPSSNTNVFTFRGNFTRFLWLKVCNQKPEKHSLFFIKIKNKNLFCDWIPSSFPPHLYLLSLSLSLILTQPLVVTDDYHSCQSLAVPLTVRISSWPEWLSWNHLCPSCLSHRPFLFSLLF